MLAQDNWLNFADELPDESIDMVLCDLPYGMTRHKWDSVIPLPDLWRSIHRVCRPDANIILFAAQPFATTLAASNLRCFKDEAIWVKNKVTRHLNARWMPLRKHEQLLIFRREGRGTYNPQMSEGHEPVHGFTKRNATNGNGTYGKERNGISGGGSCRRFPTSVIEFSKVNNDDPQRIHPNQKPVSLLEYLIKTYSNAGDTILDNTMGSGSTGIACINTCRHFVGVEQNPSYFAAAEEWLLRQSCPAFQGWAKCNALVPT